MEQRSEFRIVYPLPARPVVMLGTRRARVLDLSERGMRLDQRGLEPPVAVGERVEGVLRLAHRSDHRFEGSVLRSDELAAVVQFDEAFRVGLSSIFQEQRYLRSRFPDWR